MNTQITVTIDSELKDFLNEQARGRVSSVNKMISKILQEYVEKERKIMTI